MTLLKFVVDDELRDAYIAADRPRRDQLLAELPPGSVGDEVFGASLPDPVALDALEWFASPNDICDAHVGLQELADQPGLGPVRSILSENPGWLFDTEQWRYVAFKGGSEPGVLAGAWLAERADGRTFVVIAELRDDNQQLPEVLLGDAQAAFALLAEIP